MSSFELTVAIINVLGWFMLMAWAAYIVGRPDDTTDAAADDDPYLAKQASRGNREDGE